MKIYCAGPLFNRAERLEMTAIADRLVAAGFEVYLPHRDGMEFRLILEELVERGWSPTVAGQFLHEAIFALDVFQVAVDCDAMVWNLNGRVPDEGAVSEAAIAWTLGKPLVAYQEDVRSLINGRTNPLLVGLVEFQTVMNLDEILPALQRELQRQPPPRITVERLPEKFQRTVLAGQALWLSLQTAAATGRDDLIADCVAELFAPNAMA